MEAEIGPQLRIDHRLYAVARNGNVDDLNELLRPPPRPQGGVAVNVRGPVSLSAITFNRETALHIAASFGHIDVVTEICNQNRNLLMAVNNKSETPLHYAAEAGKGEVVSYFIQFAQNHSHPDFRMELLRWRNRDGETALYQAVRNKHIAVVDMLIQTDPHLPIIPDNKTVFPLYLAATQDLPDIVITLIQCLEGHNHVAPIAYAGPERQTALHAAALRLNREIPRRIREWKPELAKSIDDTGSTPLHYAAAKRGTDIWALVEVQDETNRLAAYISDSSGQFPVHVAATMGNLEAVSQLFAICPDSDEILDKKGRNFLHIAVEKRKFNVVRWACNNSGVVRAINARDNEGNTPLHLAVKAKDVHIFALLIASKKVHIGVMNKKGLTPLDVARAQLTTGLRHWQNSERIIIRALLAMGSCEGISRTDLFIKECNLEWNEKAIQKDSKNYENIAKSISIGSVLIASASFAGAFTVFNAYKTDVNLSQLPGLSMAFKAFVLMVVYAFTCSITATALLIRAALTFLDPKHRQSYILISIRLVMMAIRGFIGAFAIGAYVILTPVSKGLAILVCVTGIVVPAFTDPSTWPNLLVAWALLKFMGWRELMRIKRMKHPTAPIQTRDTILWDWRLFFWDNVLYSFIALLVLVGSLINSVVLRHIVLPLVGALLLLTLVDTVKLFTGGNPIMNYINNFFHFFINFIINFIVSFIFILIEHGMLLLEWVRA